MSPGERPEVEVKKTRLLKRAKLGDHGAPRTGSWVERWFGIQPEVGDPHRYQTSEKN